MPDSVFVPACARYDRPDRIVTLGHYYPQASAGTAKSVLRELPAGYAASPPPTAEPPDTDPAQMRRNVAWTRLVNALNLDRRWAFRQLLSQLDAMLAPEIAVAVVPGHAAYHIDAPLRRLAQELARTQDRVDATPCLVRHTGIQRIIYGGPSTRALHRETITVEETARIEGRAVLLLDDIAKSGASLMACRALLLEAGAAHVQALALARVVVPQG